MANHGWLGGAGLGKARLGLTGRITAGKARRGMAGTGMARSGRQGESRQAMNIGKTIRQARKAADLTQEEAATSSRLRRATWSDVERGATEPTLHTLHVMAETLGTTAGRLLAGR